MKALSALLTCSFFAFLAPNIAEAQYNRPPNAPTLLAPGNNTRLTLSQPNSTVHLQWRNNGNPDGEQVSFYLQAFYWHIHERAWKQITQQAVYGTSIPMTFGGIPGKDGYIAWQVFAIDGTRRSQPWYTASGWSVFQVVFPPKTPPPTTQTTTTTTQTSGFFGTVWEVYGHHAGSGTWTRYQNSPNVFQANWKKNGTAYQTVVTLERHGHAIVGISRNTAGKFHTRFDIKLDDTPEIGRAMTSIPRNKQFGGGQCKHEAGGNPDVAHFTLTK